MKTIRGQLVIGKDAGNNDYVYVDIKSCDIQEYLSFMQDEYSNEMNNLLKRNGDKYHITVIQAFRYAHFVKKSSLGDPYYEKILLGIKGIVESEDESKVMVSCLSIGSAADKQFIKVKSDNEENLSGEQSIEKVLIDCESFFIICRSNDVIDRFKGIGINLDINMHITIAFNGRDVFNVKKDLSAERYKYSDIILKKRSSSSKLLLRG